MVLEFCPTRVKVQLVRVNTPCDINRDKGRGRVRVGVESALGLSTLGEQYSAKVNRFSKIPNKSHELTVAAFSRSAFIAEHDAPVGPIAWGCSSKCMGAWVRVDVVGSGHR